MAGKKASAKKAPAGKKSPALNAKSVGASNKRTPDKPMRDPVRAAVNRARTTRAQTTTVHPSAMTSLEHKKKSRRPEKFISAYPVWPNPPAQSPMNAGVSGYGSTNSVGTLLQTNAPAVSSGGSPTLPQE